MIFHDRTSRPSDATHIARHELEHEAPRTTQHRTALRSATREMPSIARWGSSGGKKRVRCWVKWCRILSENNGFVLFTSLLTIYALVGDDIRVAFTDRPADAWFNILTLACIGIFSFEIIISAIGKADYFMSFFFHLDVISTFTLLFDLTWVAELIFGTGDEESGGGEEDRLRASKTARLGARGARVFRVLRLVRLFKLYKAIREAEAKRKLKQEREQMLLAGEEPDDWDDEDDEDAANQQMKLTKESRVGQKLSEMTIRRVIILVLTMLIFLSSFSTEDDIVTAPAPYLGADDVWEAFVDYRDSGEAAGKDRLRYEKTMLRYLYLNDWYVKNSGMSLEQDLLTTAQYYYATVFWAGVMAKDSSAVDPMLLEGTNPSLLLRRETVDSYESHITSQKLSGFKFYPLPSEVKSVVAGLWVNDCDGKGYIRRGFSTIGRTLDGKVGHAVKCPEDLRFLERMKFTPRLMPTDEFGKWYFAFYFDNRPFTRQEATLNLGITGFICVVLCVASMMISSDANKLVLRPVENMIKRVELIGQNPMCAIQMADEEFKAEEKERTAKTKMTKKQSLFDSFQRCILCKESKGHGGEPMETVVLEKTIIKLGSLLALGFGEAGATIIGHNMECSDSAGVNAMIEGTRVECIIGYARIRDFSTATEVLQSKVMTFVNQIAEIVHGVVNEFHGAANKNNGDTFLIIWRTSGLTQDMVARMADMSMIAFAKIVGSVHRSPILASYRGHPGLQQRLGSNCRIHVSMGLHSGWAIEGAVGSEYKIDASYLSPNVSIATSVEAATKVYGVPILVSQATRDLCTPDVASKCRLIDKVLIRGSPQPMQLFCLDLDYLGLTVDDGAGAHRPVLWNSRWRFKARQFLEAEKSRKIDPDVKLSSYFQDNKDISQMRRHYNLDFMQKFTMGYQNYSEGEWEVAKEFLRDTQNMLRGAEDGPSAALLRFMERANFKAPAGWTGIRELAPSLV